MKSFCFILVVFLVSICWSCAESAPKVESAPKTEVGKQDEASTAVAPALSQSFDGQISKKRFAGMLSSTANPQLIDIRTPEEFREGSIDGALNMDFYNDDFTSQLKSLDKTRPIFIYCKSGGRSGKTYKMLKDMGIEKVYDLKVGYDGWK